MEETLREDKSGKIVHFFHQSKTKLNKIKKYSNEFLFTITFQSNSFPSFCTFLGNSPFIQVIYKKSLHLFLLQFMFKITLFRLSRCLSNCMVIQGKSR
uniref:Uncharacterized protein n=1 Tax=Tetranychus urticae TaxID=32264 RepID=T1L2E9_TETUR